MCVFTVSQYTSIIKLHVGHPLVMLPCEFHTFELNDPTVVWSRFDLSPSTVHQRQLQGDELKEQNLLYRGRTSMTSDALETGELSLNLTNLQLSDSGTYTCSIKSFRREWRVGTVQLQVKGEKQSPTHVDLSHHSENYLFFCFLKKKKHLDLCFFSNIVGSLPHNLKHLELFNYL